jgi:hypothetical protein
MSLRASQRGVLAQEPSSAVLSLPETNGKWLVITVTTKMIFGVGRGNEPASAYLAVMSVRINPGEHAFTKMFGFCKSMPQDH